MEDVGEETAAYGDWSERYAESDLSDEMEVITRLCAKTKPKLKAKINSN